ncbi:MAG: hypothetical protein AAFW60_02865 [Pseudomonadota bacterium]
MTTLIQTDLFGHKILPDSPHRRKRGTGIPNGFPKPPGSGPDGKRCQDCANIRRVMAPSGSTFFKCAILRPSWTRGYGTDIRYRAAACSMFEVKRRHDPIPVVWMTV